MNVYITYTSGQRNYLKIILGEVLRWVFYVSNASRKGNHEISLEIILQIVDG